MRGLEISPLIDQNHGRKGREDIIFFSYAFYFDA